MISYHFLNQTTRDNFFTNDTAHGAGQLWSDVPLIPSWQQHQVPFPIIQADSRPVGSNATGRILDPASVVYEVNEAPHLECGIRPFAHLLTQITPMEFGSWDPTLSAMVNISYVGTHLTNGQPDNATACTTQFDQTGFVMGTSASLFNVSIYGRLSPFRMEIDDPYPCNQQILDVARSKIEGFDDSSSKGLMLVLGRQLGELRTRADDVANWPNVRPFSRSLLVGGAPADCEIVCR
jgi:lysophospholipase